MFIHNLRYSSCVAPNQYCLVILYKYIDKINIEINIVNVHIELIDVFASKY